MLKPNTTHRGKPPSLKREITLAIALKLVLLFLVWWLWFDHPMPQDLRAENTARVILNR